MRDRLVASLARRLDFVSVAEGGNMARLALLGLRAGRRVRVGAWVAGRDALIEAGAEALPEPPATGRVAEVRPVG